MVLALPSAPAAYLFSLTAGLKGYASRQQLIQALTAQGIETEGLALELIERKPFEAQMEHYLLHRATGLARAADALASMPILDSYTPSAENAPVSTLLGALDAFWEAGPPRHTHTQLLRQSYRAGFLQALLSGRQGRFGPEAMALLQTDPHATNVRWARLCLQEGSEQTALAGVLVWYLPGQPGRCLYNPDTGLAWYASEQALLEAQASQPQGPLALPAAGQVRWRLASSRQLRLEPLSGDPFHRAVDEVRAVQALDVYETLLSLQGEAAQAKMILVEDALDLRARLDRRLLTLDPKARWTDQQAPELTPVPDPKVLPEQEGERVAQLAEVRDCRAEVALAQPGVDQVIDSLLVPWLAVFGQGFTPRQLKVTLNDDMPGRTLSLDELLLERLTGLQAGPLPATAVLEWEGYETLAGFDSISLEACLRDASEHFAERYQAHLDRLYYHGHRVNGRWLDAYQVMGQTLEWVLRADLALAVDKASLPSATVGLLQAAIEGSAAVEAYGIDLEQVGQGSAVRLADVAVLRLTPAATQPEGGGAVLFWSSALGLQAADSLQALSERIVTEISKQAPDNPWLGLLPSVDEALLQVLHDKHAPATIKAHFWAMEGNLLHRLQKSAHGHRLQQSQRILGLLRRGRFRPAITRVVLDGVAAEDGLWPAMNRLALGWVDRQATGVLPTWVREASYADQQRFIHYLRDCARVATPSQDYLEGLPTVETFAREQVSRKLIADGFEPGVNPDHVRITSRAYVPALVTIGSLPSAIPAAVSVHEQSLSEATLQPSAWLRETMTLSRDDGGELPPALTPGYVRSLVRDLDCGGRYRALLQGTLGPGNPDFDLRRGRFLQQMRRQMLMTGFALKLKGTLGAVAFRLIEQLAQAPDAQARDDAGIEGVTLRLLQVRALPGHSADTCEGVYLLEQPAGDGPVVVFTLYSRDAAFVEYPSHQAFEHALRTDQRLRAGLLERIEPLRQPVYTNGGFDRPHVNHVLPEGVSDLVTPVGPAQWLTPPVLGNAFHRLYADNLALLRAMAQAQTVSAQEARWQDFRYLIGLAVEQGTMFLPIPFAAVIGLWQSRQLAGAALAAARNRKWGQALSEMVAAMANVLSLAAPGAHAPPPLRTLAWSLDSTLSVELRQRLAAMEVTDRDLAELPPVPAEPLYQSGQDYYASVQGKVFRVGQQAGQWHILDQDLQWGPPIKLGTGNRWQLDLGLRGGGPVASRYRREQVLDAIENQFVVTESGLREIRRFKPTHAVQLEGSLVQAQRVLHRAERKLAIPAAITPETRQVLEDTFGPGQVTPALVRRLHGMIESIYAEAVGTSLRNGNRWVLCTPTPGNELSVAFIVTSDAKRRIFLSDTFFDASTITPVSASASQAGFDPLRYLQSAVLIHELSHWSLRTDDFTYLGLGTPYFDLIEPDVWQTQGPQIEAERRSLSHDTPASRLFRAFAVNQLPSADRSTLRRLLKLTKQNELAGAIAVYQANPVIRNEIILGNADSITWLALQLGRDAPAVRETAV
jgi:hypothetical protein